MIIFILRSLFWLLGKKKIEMKQQGSRNIRREVVWLEVPGRQ
jgi:hypothetical protein